MSKSSFSSKQRHPLQALTVNFDDITISTQRYWRRQQSAMNCIKSLEEEGTRRIRFGRERRNAGSCTYTDKLAPNKKKSRLRVRGAAQRCSSGAARTTLTLCQMCTRRRRSSGFRVPTQPFTRHLSRLVYYLRPFSFVFTPSSFQKYHPLSTRSSEQNQDGSDQRPLQSFSERLYFALPAFGSQANRF